MSEEKNKEQNKIKILVIIGVLVFAAAILIVLLLIRSQNTILVENENSDFVDSPVKEEDGFMSRDWTWVNTQMNDGAEFLPSTEEAFTLTFQEDGRVVAKTDCNGGNGSYELGPDNTIKFGPMATSMMFCEGSTETEFYQQLSNVGSYAIQDGQLWLMIKFDSGTMIFE